MRIEPKHHEVFMAFPRWSGEVPAGFEVDFIGSKYRTEYWAMFIPQPNERYESPPYPPFNEEYFEWIDLLQAVTFATDRFCMLEVGAGFGRWSARAAAAASQRSLPHSVTAVEAEPTHFKWLEQNLRDNEVDPSSCRLIQAAVAGNDGQIGFAVGDPDKSYGQSIGGPTQVEAISLATLLLPHDRVDLVDMDIQGAELEVLTPAAKPLNEKVKRIHIETHSPQVHSGIFRLFRTLNWRPHFLFAGGTIDVTPWGSIKFQEGVQSWLNPRLCPKDELDCARILTNSVRWRAVQFAHRTASLMAPVGSLRREALRATILALRPRRR